jgi:hypothetical protein
MLFIDSPKCSKYQKLVYNTGINQTVELECRMTDSNPPYLEFTWNFANSEGSKDRVRSNGFVSRVNWTPKSEQDFGEINCLASNGLEPGECKMILKLGGSPNPPYDCYYKENNKTIIIECKPGFDQGDPEVYFYLLKKKSSGVLVEYARKRDSCSFLISNSILEEHQNEFLIYSSNKYGNNREQASKLVIENKEFAVKNLSKYEDLKNKANKKLTYIAGIVVVAFIFLFFVCCTYYKCKIDKHHEKMNGGIGGIRNHHHHHHLTNGSLNGSIRQLNLNGSLNHLNHNSNNYNSNNFKSYDNKNSYNLRNNSITYQEPYRYSHYSSKTSIHAAADTTAAASNVAYMQNAKKQNNEGSR